MNRLSVNKLAKLSLGMAIVASVSLITGAAQLSNFGNSGVAVAQNAQPQPKVQLNLTAAKKVLRQDKQGKQEIIWETLQGNVVVQPGDVIRYTLNGKNNSDRAVKNLVVTQPIPQKTIYVLNSATVSKNAGTKIIYSIDNGKTFVEKPTIQVKLPDGKIETRPAPAELYTHLRFNFGQVINPAANLQANYQVKVQ